MQILTPRAKTLISLILSNKTQKEIAEEVGITQRAVCYAVREFCEKGLIKKSKHGRHVHYKTNEKLRDAIENMTQAAAFLNFEIGKAMRKQK